ncbi:MAG: hypothetical protein ACLGQW_10035 [Acidobacteriota bacterium]
MKSGSPSFLKYAGAMPAYAMFKAQRLAQHQDIPTEKPADSPDRPDNILTPMRTSDISGGVQTAPPTGAAQAADPDSPDAVLERGRQAAANSADNPDAILARGRQAAPEQSGGRILTETA